MSPRAKKTEVHKRGPGRPRLDPDREGPGLYLPIRIADRHFVELRRLMSKGHGANMSETIRYLIEESASASKAPTEQPRRG